MHGMLGTGLRVETRPLTALDDIAGAWRDLIDRAAEPNVFYEPAFARAAAPVFGRGVTVDLVWQASGEPRLLGFFPMRRRRFLSIGWTHPYAPLGTPLVDAARREEVVAAWLDGSATPNVLLPLLPVEGPLARAVAARASRLHDYDLHRRALLEPGPERGSYLARALGSKNHKELPRKRRRLAERGTLTHDVTQDADDFLALEASGWKGRAGTAAAKDPALSEFVRRAVEGLAREGKAHVDLLRLDGRAIAALVMLRSGATVSSWKIAYDEDFARYSPGVQLVLDATKAALADPMIADVDSCAAAAHPMIDHVWRERLALADRLVAARPNRAFATLAALESARRTARRHAKRLRDRLRALA